MYVLPSVLFWSCGNPAFSEFNTSSSALLRLNLDLQSPKRRWRQNTIKLSRVHTVGIFIEKSVTSLEDRRISSENASFHQTLVRDTKPSRGNNSLVRSLYRKRLFTITFFVIISFKIIT